MIEQFGLPSRGRRSNALEGLPLPQVIVPQESHIRGNESAPKNVEEPRRISTPEPISPRRQVETPQQSQTTFTSGISRMPDTTPHRGGGIAGGLLAGIAGIALSGIASLGKGISKAGTWVTKPLDKVLDKGIHKTQDFVFRKVPQFLKRSIKKLFGLDKGHAAHESAGGHGHH